MSSNTQLRVALAGETPSQAAVDACDGVGMIRGEYLMRIANAYTTTPQGVQVIEDYLKQIAATFYPRPVWYRLADPESRDIAVLSGCDVDLHEDNPRLGDHGTRRGLRFPGPMRAELGAVSRAAQQYSNIHLFFPFVATPEELSQAMGMARQAGFPNQIGTMIETPLAALNVDRFCDLGVSQVTIGMNDLPSLLLGADRESAFYKKTHPLVLDVVRTVIERAHAKGVEVSIAGNFKPQEARPIPTLGADFFVVHYHELPLLAGIDAAKLQQLDMNRQIWSDARAAMKQHELARVLGGAGEIDGGGVSGSRIGRTSRTLPGLADGGTVR